jgi:hypothetical protein
VTILRTSQADGARSLGALTDGFQTAYTVAIAFARTSERRAQATRGRQSRMLKPDGSGTTSWTAKPLPSRSCLYSAR